MTTPVLPSPTSGPGAGHGHRHADGPSGPVGAASAAARMVLASPWGRIGLGLVAFLTAAITSSSDDGFVLCPFRRCTGGYCPACGLTRASGKLVRGDLAGSWQHHPFLILGVAQAALLGSLWASGSGLWSTIERRMTWLLGVNAAVLVGIWVVRLVAGDIPVPFATW